MSVQRLGAKKLRRLSRIVGADIKLAWASGGYDYAFVTIDHRHGSYDLKTGEWTIQPEAVLTSDSPLSWPHLSSCYTDEWPEELRAR